MAHPIDLNADMGEYHDEAGAAREDALMEFVTSCSIACGGHAGDDDTMRRTVRRAQEHHVKIGAHPSLPDREGFGRRVIDIQHADLAQSFRTQLNALSRIAAEEGAALSHVKPHGALYHMAASQPDIAAMLTEIAGDLIIVGPPNSALARAAKNAGCRFAPEGFIDRKYRADGSLTPRGTEGAVIASIEQRALQARRLAAGEPIETDDGPLTLEVRTLCIHSDSPRASETAQAVRHALDAAHIPVKALPDCGD